jgi:DNA polymerase-1
MIPTLVTPAQAPAPAEIIVIDTEFRADPGELPIVWCLSGQEYYSGRRFSYWRNELQAMTEPPFRTGWNVAVVAFYALAEWLCFLQLGWALPAQPIDLYAEFRVRTCRYFPKGVQPPRSLYAALAWAQLEPGDVAHKALMRELAMTRRPDEWTAAEQHQLQFYCDDDVARTVQLTGRLLPEMPWPQARLRGLYTEAVAATEHEGIPIDHHNHRRLVDNWEAVKRHYIDELERRHAWQFYEDGEFRTRYFIAWLVDRGWTWPCDEAGTPKLDDDTFKEMARVHPEVEALRRLRSHITELRLTKLKIGSDHKNRCLTSVFQSATGRTQSSSTEHILFVASWLRGLIKPSRGQAVAILDWKAQEYFIAAIQTGDKGMIEACLSGDPYLHFARVSGLTRTVSSEGDLEVLRKRCKVVCLGVLNGMTKYGIARELGLLEAEAEVLLQLHKDTYRQFWAWVQDAYNRALVAEEMSTVFGWKWRPLPYQTKSGEISMPSRGAIANFNWQAAGADIMRGAAILTVRAGVKLIATQHDSLAITAPQRELVEAIRTTRAAMNEASEVVTGFHIEIDDGNRITWPHRHSGGPTWERTMALLDCITRRA